MNTLSNLVAKLDYPSGPVMFLATAACLAFIFVGGYWFKRADERSRAEREALKASSTKSSTELPTSP